MMNSQNVKRNDSNEDIDIKIFGVGGGGGNAINNMIRENVKGVEFYSANTDVQALEASLTKNRIQLGPKLTKGLGAGADPIVGRKSAEEVLPQIKKALDGAKMVFITSGMGGGTGTGAAPVIAKAAHNKGILTVAVVTKPFMFEGTSRAKNAQYGLKHLKKNVDSLFVINNNSLLDMVSKKTSFLNAFKVADNVLRKGIVGITSLITQQSYINLDFADVTTVMKNQGYALMGLGKASGKNRAVEATKNAINSPLLTTSIRGAKQVLLNISGGNDLSLQEAQSASNLIRKNTSDNINIIFGTSIDKQLGNKVQVTVIATGIDHMESSEESSADIFEAKHSNQANTTQSNNASNNDTNEKEDNDIHETREDNETREEYHPKHLKTSSNSGNHIPSYFGNEKKNDDKSSDDESDKTFGERMKERIKRNLQNSNKHDKKLDAKYRDKFFSRKE